MGYTGKNIRLSNHALNYRPERGFSIEEVELAICNAEWEPAERGKLECRFNFRFEAMWNGRRYQSKQVRPVFVDEPLEIVVITVYTYYF